MASTLDASPSGLDSYFKITERGSSLRTEVRAGLATYLVMAYIVFFEPDYSCAPGL